MVNGLPLMLIIMRMNNKTLMTYIKYYTDNKKRITMKCQYENRAQMHSPTFV